MALFLSHKYHNVLPIRSGKRHVLVMELWNGPEKTCPHRCETVGKCTHTLNRSHLGNFSQHVGLLGWESYFVLCTCKYLKYILNISEVHMISFIFYFFNLAHTRTRLSIKISPHPLCWPPFILYIFIFWYWFTLKIIILIFYVWFH